MSVTIAAKAVVEVELQELPVLDADGGCRGPRRSRVTSCLLKVHTNKHGEEEQRYSDSYSNWTGIYAASVHPFARRLCPEFTHWNREASPSMRSALMRCSPPSSFILRLC